MQLVYEFGAKELQPIMEAIRRALSDAPYAVKCLPNDSDTYSQTEDSLESAALKLQRGEIASFSLHPENGLVRYALVTCPFFDGQALSVYLGTVEYLGSDYKAIWNQVLGVPGLNVACLGFEEGVELNDSMLSAETFPWNEWPLVVGAIRDQRGHEAWQIKQGPEMKWFARAS